MKIIILNQAKSHHKYLISKISENFDIYINDAFSASHRCHSSIVGITKFLPSYGGYLFEKEITE